MGVQFAILGGRLPAQPGNYNRDVNVTVVGAGVIGCAVAYELASRGASVHVVDRRGVGKGATRASAGMLAPYIEGHDDALLRLGIASLERYNCFIQRLRADSQQPIEYEQAGTLQVAVTAEEASHLEESAARLIRRRVPHSLVDGSATRRVEPMLAADVCAGLLIPGHAYVAAGSLMGALYEGAVGRGATFELADVEHVERDGDGMGVSINGRCVASDAVVIAAGSWSGAFASGHEASVRPVRGQLLHLRLDRRAASRVIWGRGCYLVPWHDGSVLVGATVEDAGFEEAATVEGVRSLLDHACALAPLVSTARLHEVRVGLRPATPDELPVIGASTSTPGLFYATGHYRNGVLLAPLTAKLMVDLILDGRHAPELDLTRPERFGL